MCGLLSSVFYLFIFFIFVEMLMVVIWTICDSVLVLLTDAGHGFALRIGLQLLLFAHVSSIFVSI